MASLIRLRQLPLNPIIQRTVWNHMNNVCRTISTSRKDRDSAAPAAEIKVEEQDKNWVSYGFDYTSKTEDTNAHNASFFFSVTLCLVFGGFSWAYAPDTLNRDWTQREAFLELRRRELAGEPPISANYVDPKNIVLPSDEDIRDVEIII